jgi:hypothetical protein
MASQSSHPSLPSRRDVQAALSSIDFPIDKEQLVRCVERSDAPDLAVVRQLRALPLATYRSLAEVLASVESADDTPGATT